MQRIPHPQCFTPPFHSLPSVISSIQAILITLEHKCLNEVAIANSNADAYTIHAVSQDDFSDVPMPDAPPQPAQAPNTGVVKAVSPDAVPRQN